MYCKVEGGQVISYPYRLDRLRLDNKRVSFPSYINNTLAAQYGVYPVVEAIDPDFDERTQKIEKSSSPTLVGGKWTITKTVVDLSVEDQAKNDKIESDDVRNVRDRRLFSTDWTQFNDSPLDGATKQSWSIYRQQLRDITSHANFPYLDADDWPTTP